MRIIDKMNRFGYHKASRSTSKRERDAEKILKIHVPRQELDDKERDNASSKNSKKANIAAKFMTNRASNVSPVRYSDFGQLISDKGSAVDQYQNVLLEQYGFDPILPDTINQLKELRRVLCGGRPKIENGSQYANPDTPQNDLSDLSTWHNVDTVEDVDRYIKDNGVKYTSSDSKNTKLRVVKRKMKKEVQQDNNETSPKNIYISDVPTIKFIAEKYSTFKKNDIELRKLNEKIVCVEYDIFDQDDARESPKPIQKMRAFFSIKPPNRLVDGEIDGQESPLSEIPSFIKHKYHIADEDLKKLNEKEIEIIDEKIADNKPYLEDLKTILKRKNVPGKRNKNSLDLQYLYEMAKRECPPEDYDFSKLLSKAELDEVKELILKRCVSSVHGISRRHFNGKNVIDSDENCELKSKNTIMELMKDVSTV